MPRFYYITSEKEGMMGPVEEVELRAIAAEREPAGVCLEGSERWWPYRELFPTVKMGHRTPLALWCAGGMLAGIAGGLVAFVIYAAATAIFAQIAAILVAGFAAVIFFLAGAIWCLALAR
jgi:hypothetical protein